MLGRGLPSPCQGIPKLYRRAEKNVKCGGEDVLDKLVLERSEASALYSPRSGNVVTVVTLLCWFLTGCRGRTPAGARGALATPFFLSFCAASGGTKRKITNSTKTRGDLCVISCPMSSDGVSVVSALLLPPL